MEAVGGEEEKETQTDTPKPGRGNSGMCVFVLCGSRRCHM